MYNVWMVMPLI